MHHLVCLGLSHRTAPVELRERIGALGVGAERCPAVLEHVVLQTCYRVELYARLTSGIDDARDELVDALSFAHDVPRELLLDHLYVHSGEDVARHLCRVAAWLDSLVLGEAEILGQVGEAYETGAAVGTAGPGEALTDRDLDRPARPHGDGDRPEPRPRARWRSQSPKEARRSSRQALLGSAPGDRVADPREESAGSVHRGRERGGAGDRGIPRFGA